MATSIDYSGAIKRIIVPEADLTLIDAGPPALYELDTDTFFDDVKALEANESGMVWQNAIDHNPEYTVSGETFARKIEIMNSTNTNPVFGAPNTDEYEVFFDPDNQYSVKLTGSNNNIFDLQNAILANSTTQVIPTNSAGLIVGTGSGLSAAEASQLLLLYQDRGFDSGNIVTVDETAGTISVAGTVRTWVGGVIKTLTRTT